MLVAPLRKICGGWSLVQREETPINSVNIRCCVTFYIYINMSIKNTSVSDQKYTTFLFWYHWHPLSNYLKLWLTKPCISLACGFSTFECNWHQCDMIYEWEEVSLGRHSSPGWTPPWRWPQSTQPPPIPQSLAAGPHRMNSLTFAPRPTNICLLCNGAPTAGPHFSREECQACQSTNLRNSLPLSPPRPSCLWQWRSLCVDELMLPDRVQVNEVRSRL